MVAADQRQMSASTARLRAKLFELETVVISRSGETL